MKIVKGVERKYYKWGTTPTTISHGNPTITNGVVSNFSTSNYLTLPERFQPANYNNFEIFLKITTGSNITSEQEIFGGYYNSSGIFYGVNIAINGSGFRLAVGNGSSNIMGGIGTSTVLPNTTYYLKAKFTGTVYSLESSTDNETWVTEKTVTSSTKATASESYSTYIGQLYYQSHGGFFDVFYGTLDLSKSYIKVNGKDWWHGTLPVESTAEDYDFYKDVNIVKVNKKEIIHYWKYIYTPWTQPVLTSDTSSPLMTLSATSTYTPTFQMYYAFDGSQSTGWLSADGTWSGSLRVKFSDLLIISSIVVYGWGNENGYTNEVKIYKDLTDTTQIGETIAPLGGIGASHTWTFETPVETDELSFYASGVFNWGSIGEIQINAQKREIIESTSEDYDFTTTEYIYSTYKLS